MKTNVLKMIICFYIGALFVSCSNNDEENRGIEISKKTQIAVAYPDKVYSTDLDIFGVEENYFPRCILEIRSKGENGQTVYRKEVIADASTENLTFDFELETGIYDCMVWVDYVDATTKVDKYYDTSNLVNVRIKGVKDFFNNEKCTAFYYSGELQKTDEALQEALTLKCALTKISVSEQNLNEFAYLTDVKVAYNAYVGFNVLAGKIIGETIEAVYENNTFDPAMVPDGTYFTTYVLADDEERTLGICKLTLTTKIETIEENMPDIINLIQGNHVKVSGNILGDKEHNTEYEITYEIDVEDWTNSEITITPGSH